MKISCIVEVKLGIHVKMNASKVEKTTSRSMLEISENTKSGMPMDLLGHMHKLVKETHGISDFRECNG